MFFLPLAVAVVLAYPTPSLTDLALAAPLVVAIVLGIALRYHLLPHRKPTDWRN